MITMAVTREVFWGVPANLQLFFYGAAAVAVVIFFLGIWNRVSIWTLGRDDEKFQGFSSWTFFIFAFKSFFSRNCILAKKSFQLAWYRGVMLFFIIWGFSTLFIGTVFLTVHHYSVRFLVGKPYLIYSLILDVGGLLLLAGLVIAIVRRHLLRDVRRVTSREDLFLLYLFLFIVVTGFSLEGIRLIEQTPLNMDYSIGGFLFSYLLGTLGAGGAEYILIWTIHSASVLFLIAYLPFSKFFHVFASQITVAAAEKRYGGAIGGR